MSGVVKELRRGEKNDALRRGPLLWPTGEAGVRAARAIRGRLAAGTEALLQGAREAGIRITGAARQRIATSAEGLVRAGYAARIRIMGAVRQRLTAMAEALSQVRQAAHTGKTNAVRQFRTAMAETIFQPIREAGIRTARAANDLVTAITDTLIELGRQARIRTIRALRLLFSAMAAGIAELIRFLVLLGRAFLVLIKVTVIGAMLSSLALAAAMLWALYSVPVERPAGSDGPSLLVEAANGQPLGRVGPLGDAVRRRDFPDVLVKAVLSIEDRRFHDHWGLDPWSVGRAMHANLAAKSIVEGGSTIAQQLVKMQIVGAERSLDRKIREALTAIWLDLRLGKDEILTRYLNTVYLGAGAYGMSAAARMYFDKGLAELTLPEAAMLAGLIQAPSRYNPVRNLDAAHRRAAVVIDAMLETGTIDAAAAEKAKTEPAMLKLSPRTVRAGSWFADWIARHEVPKIAGSVRRPLRVRTTLQPEVQQLAERVVNNALTRQGDAHGASQAALVAMRPDGAVIAMVGGRDYDESQFNRAVDAQRQPGSAFKLFVYYAALRNGYSPEDRINASPVEIGGWRPENSGRQRYGYMTLSQAFASSANSAAVRLGRTVGLDKVVAAARELGLDAPLAEVPSLPLGTVEVSLLDITGAFASVRAAHPKLEPWGISAFGAEGGWLRSLGAPVLSAPELPHHHELTRLLRDVVDRGTGRAAALDDGYVAGKTGTSQDYRDAWFIGFNDALIVGVWVGNDDRSPMAGVTGGSLPAQIWKRFVSAATPLVERSAAPVAGETPAPSSPVAVNRVACDQSACAAAYDTFRTSDCTYQPYAGPRRLCEKGVSDAASQTSASASTASVDGPCDRDRCARRYRSFDPMTCTYRRHGSRGRRICREKAGME